jgi:hypothetical protein
LSFVPPRAPSSGKSWRIRCSGGHCWSTQRVRTVGGGERTRTADFYVANPLEPVETYLAYLAALERSPNTQWAYATSLKLWFEFLDRIERSWAEVDIDDVARFVSRLRAPADNVVVLAAGDAVRSA